MKNFRILTALSMVGFLASPCVAASPETQQALDAVATDSQLLGNWFSAQLKHVVAFNSTSGMVMPESLQAGRVAVGLHGVVSATLIDTSGLENLPTELLNTQDIDLLSRLPMPALVAYGKVGLPRGFDAGVRVGGFPRTKFMSESETDDETGAAQQTDVSARSGLFGFDLRKTLIQGGAGHLFGLIVGTNYTHASGRIDATYPFSTKDMVTINSGGNTYEVNTRAQSSNVTKWDTDSLGLQAIVNMPVSIVTSYIGAGVNRNWGSVTNDFAASGTMTLEEQGPGGVQTEALSTHVGSKVRPDRWDTRLLAGMEIKLLRVIRFGLYGEYAGSRNVSATIGLRAQFN